MGLLLARGVDVLAVGGAQEWTPLYWAVRQKAGPEVIALLRTAAAAATAVTGATGASGGGAGGGGEGEGEGGGEGPRLNTNNHSQRFENNLVESHHWR